MGGIVFEVLFIVVRKRRRECMSISYVNECMVRKVGEIIGW